MIAAAEKVEQTHKIISEEIAYQHTYYLPEARFNKKCWNWFESTMTPLIKQYQEKLHEKYGKTEAKSQWEIFADQSQLKNLAARHNWKFKFE